MSIYIVTDVTCDLPQKYIDKQKDFTVINMPCRLDGREISVRPYDESSAVHDLYEAMRQGKPCTTAQVPLDEYQSLFAKLLDAGHEVIYICFTSGCSGTYQTALMARNMVLESRPGAKLFVLDSLCPSGGEGLLVHYALEKRAQGMSVEKLAQWILDNRQHIAHWFTVDDLDFLYRGGRVSKTSAFIGGMMKIKPILHVNFEGRLIPREKVAGRKRSLKALAEKYTELAVPQEGQLVVINHGDCEEDARYTADYLRKIAPAVGKIVINPICPIVGAHSGPGTVAIFFLCEAR